jgi:hypothetical protein
MRPQRLARETFEAFRLNDDGRPSPLPTCSGASLGDCATDAAQLCLHKERFMVRRTDALTGEVTLHFYAVKQKSAPVWIGGKSLRPLYAEHLFDLKAGGVL